MYCSLTTAFSISENSAENSLSDIKEKNKAAVIACIPNNLKHNMRYTKNRTQHVNLFVSV